MAFVWTGTGRGPYSKVSNNEPLRITKCGGNNIRIFLSDQVRREMMGDGNVMYFRFGYDRDARRIAMMVQRHPAAGWRMCSYTKSRAKKRYIEIVINTMTSFGIKPDELAPYNYPDFAKDRDSGMYVALLRNRISRSRGTSEDA